MATEEEGGGSVRADATERTCSQCRATKPLSEYYVMRGNLKRYDCIDCTKRRLGSYRDQEGMRETSAARSRAWYSLNREKARDTKLRKNYGITLAQYNCLVEEQRGLCAICLKPESNPGIPLSVDHCHTTGAVRGLLCKKCNVGLGALSDNPALLRRAAKYLESQIRGVA